jgi:hypothetical protein
MKYVAELEPGVFVAPWSGDPGRCLNIGNAKEYKTTAAARAAITRARKYRPFLNAQVVVI